jgi:hypothetical protein
MALAANTASFARTILETFGKRRESIDYRDRFDRNHALSPKDKPD